MARPGSRPRARSSPSGYFYGAVHAVTFTPDGRYLAAVGDGTMIWLAEMEPRVRQIRDLGTPAAPLRADQQPGNLAGSSAPPRPAPARGATPGAPGDRGAHRSLPC